jgi:hypothetical protein
MSEASSDCVELSALTLVVSQVAMIATCITSVKGLQAKNCVALYVRQDLNHRLENLTFTHMQKEFIAIRAF